MAGEYQEPDWRVVDYQLFCLDEKVIDRSSKRPLLIRGPQPQHLDKGKYFVCLGAAQTFGRFCQQPFPSLLQQSLGMPALNISHGGAGPAFFCGDNVRLLEYVNDASFVIIQVMSGRSASNSFFESDGVGHYRRRSDGSYLGCDEAFGELIRTQRKSVIARVVEETRRSWYMSYRQLLADIRVPKVLFWFGTRGPDYKQGWRSLSKLFGDFPQLVNAEMIFEVKQLFDEYVECVTQRGMPQTLVDRFTGAKTTVSDQWSSEPWAMNWYYPSPEMQEDAAKALEVACRSLAVMR